MLRRTYLIGACAFLLLTGCGGSLKGPPAFEQMYGTVDEPCAPSKLALSHCTAHVLLVNRGGEGLGHATIVVPLKDSTATASAARIIATVKCGRSIPDTPPTGYTDLTCDFDLPVGKTVAALPSLQSVDFTAVSSSSSSNDISGIATIGLPAVAGLLAVAALAAAVVGRRRRTAGLPSSPAPASPQPGAEESTW